MKQMSIWQRINTALAVLVLLLMTGGGLALWIDKAVTTSERRGEELANRVDRIHLDELLMHDALRGFLFEARVEGEKKRRNDAVAHLAANFGVIEEKFKKHPNLLHSIQ